MKRFIVFTALAVLLVSSAAFADEVFVTKNGKKYHQQTCPLIKSKGAQALDIKIVLEQGLEPCSKCFKDKLSDDSQQKSSKGSFLKSEKKTKK